MFVIDFHYCMHIAHCTQHSPSEPSDIGKRCIEYIGFIVCQKRSHFFKSCVHADASGKYLPSHAHCHPHEYMDLSIPCMRKKHSVQSNFMVKTCKQKPKLCAYKNF